LRIRSQMRNSADSVSPTAAPRISPRPQAVARVLREFDGFSLGVRLLTWCSSQEGSGKGEACC
jgi:hypothetical protein